MGCGQNTEREALSHWQEVVQAPSPRPRESRVPEPEARPGRPDDETVASPGSSSAHRGARIKRCIDVIGSATALVLFAPCFALIALCVRVQLGRPILFRQIRPGLHARPFEMVKFRTMREARDGEASPESDALRLTRFGKFLRATSLDELPSLWTVLRGDMSLVGPRPLLMSYMSRYDRLQATRHDVKPGITGLAQVNGRNAMSWERRLELDVQYVQECSLRLDLKILGATVVKVFKREGIQYHGHPTMPEFRGTMTSEREVGA